MKLKTALKALTRRSKLRRDPVPSPTSTKFVGLIDHSETPSSHLESKIARNVPHFKLGLKEVHLPQFVVALLYEPKLSPHFARFRVPLWFSKLDLRDYLYHCYNVRAFNIRSALRSRPIELMETIAPGMMKRRYHRKQPIKLMTIEMNEPFHWPEAPEEIRVADARAARKRLGQSDPENETEPDHIFNTQLFRDERDAREKRQDPDSAGRRVPWFEGSDDMLYRPDHAEGQKQSDAVREPTVKEFRDAYAAEAEKLLAGRSKWSPTWKTMQDFMPLTPRDGGRLRDEK